MTEKIALAQERPILFSGEMVGAILDGRKTQTRRIVKLGEWQISDWAPDFAKHLRTGETRTLLETCPYGKPGDRLWVREAWRPFTCTASPGCSIDYRATQVDCSDVRWRPSIHMPRWASRITLEVEDVRVERLTQISSEDAIAEGFEGWLDMPKLEFRRLWDQLNGKRLGCDWDSNPWVWAISFRRLES